MRLINADILKQQIAAAAFKKGTEKAAKIANGVFNIIDGQPTAYDVDKVVEQLDKLTTEECTLHECGLRSEHCKACIAKKAIQIVKAGGRG